MKCNVGAVGGHLAVMVYWIVIKGIKDYTVTQNFH